MAVGADSYGTVERVEVLIRDVIDGGTFETSTTPTEVNVESWIDDVSDEINHTLRSNGYTVPVTNTGNNVEAFGLLTKAVVAEAAAIVLNVFPGPAFDPEDPEPLRNRIGFLHKQYTSVIKVIGELKLSATRTTNKFSRIYSGAQKDSSGNTQVPIFTRAVHDFPASRSLTE